MEHQGAVVREPATLAAECLLVIVQPLAKRASSFVRPGTFTPITSQTAINLASKDLANLKSVERLLGLAVLAELQRGGFLVHYWHVATPQRRNPLTKMDSGLVNRGDWI
jgi:hypothetical protein